MAAQELGVTVNICECRTARDLTDDLDALILPGGESTTMRIASRYEEVLDAMYGWMSRHSQRPVLATCAGAILLAQPPEPMQPFIQATISRNAWGRQRESFQADIRLVGFEEFRGSVFISDSPKMGLKALEVGRSGASTVGTSFPGVFIRAPRFDRTTIKSTPVAWVDDEVVGVLEGTKLALTFHPELTQDRTFHRWLLTTAVHSREAAR